jgi:hypothetical protein
MAESAAVTMMRSKGACSVQPGRVAQLGGDLVSAVPELPFR